MARKRCSAAVVSEFAEASSLWLEWTGAQRRHYNSNQDIAWKCPHQSMFIGELAG